MKTRKAKPGRKAKKATVLERVEQMIAEGLIDREVLERGKMMASIPKAEFRRIVAEVKAENDGELSMKAVETSCAAWVAKQKSEEQEGQWLMNGLLWIMRALVKRRQAEFPMELSLTCAHGPIGRISFCSTRAACGR
jgi:hypothetical protein